MNILMQFTLNLVVFCSLIFSAREKWERINSVWEIEAIDGLEIFGNDGSEAVFQLTNEFSNIGDGSEKVILSSTSNEAIISLPIQNTLTGQSVIWIDGNAVNSGNLPDSQVVTIHNGLNT